MTPAARAAAAIEVLDEIAQGQAAERALTNWARRSRYAGSGDRAAIRDLVFSVLRCRRSCAALGGGETGRALVLGALADSGLNHEEVFGAGQYGPAALNDDEKAHLARPQVLDPLVALDCPDWLAPLLQESLGADFAPVMTLLRQRAPVFLRANIARASREECQASLGRDGIECQPHPLSKTALEVTGNARKVSNSEAYQSGLVEVQDAASQAIVDLMPLRDGMRVLDYCAGGGGKSLAMAARANLELFAHDANLQRMRDLPVRANRAGARISVLGTEDISRMPAFDLVLLDVPCSGSGSWRRAPEAKWTFTTEKLASLLRTQAQILDDTLEYVASGGVLAYVTCSLLNDENREQVMRFLGRHTGWKLLSEQRLTPLDGGDGFYAALLTRVKGVF